MFNDSYTPQIPLQIFIQCPDLICTNFLNQSGSASPPSLYKIKQFPAKRMALMLVNYIFRHFYDLPKSFHLKL